VNKGPGSYSGIRSGIAYAQGLLHAGLIDKAHIYSYTTFAFICAAMEIKPPIYFKAWPRIPTTTFEETKGYFQDESGQVSYKEYAEIKDSKNLTLFSEQQNLEVILLDATCSKLADNVAKSKQNSDLTPLYINPVHITSK
jgi:tRNA A37 threonylcarbamoyladenosine modification protein TsaB